MLAHLLLLGVVLVWGTTFSLVKAALAVTRVTAELWPTSRGRSQLLPVAGA